MPTCVLLLPFRLTFFVVFLSTVNSAASSSSVTMNPSVNILTPSSSTPVSFDHADNSEKDLVLDDSTESVSSSPDLSTQLPDFFYYCEYYSNRLQVTISYR